jgi:four helix bundle protein
LALGSWLLALGSWLLALGSWLLALGSWLLALGSWLIGCWLLVDWLIGAVGWVWLNMDDETFNFENLEVWQEAVDFADHCLRLVEQIETGRKHFRPMEQLESAATSPALNIAEGKGRFSKKEFIQYLYIAKGSIFETVTLLEIFRRRQWIKDIEFKAVKRMAIQLGKRLNSLINSLR